MNVVGVPGGDEGAGVRGAGQTIDACVDYRSLLVVKVLQVRSNFE